MKQLYFKDGDGNKLLDNTNRIVLIKATEGDSNNLEVLEAGAEKVGRVLKTIAQLEPSEVEIRIQMENGIT